MNTNLFITKRLWGGKESGKGFSAVSSIIASLSVAISALVIVLAVFISDGFKHEIKMKASGFSGEILLHSPGVDITTSVYPVPSFPFFFDSLKSFREVRSLSPYVYRSAIVKNNEEIQGVMIKGVDSLYNWEFFSSVLVEGELPNQGQVNGGNPEILISSRLSDLLGYVLGDVIVTYFIDDGVKVRKFKISGIYNARLEDIDMTLLVTEASVIRKLNGWSDDFSSGLEVKLNDGASLSLVADKIESLIENDKGDYSYFVTKVSDLFPHLFDWLVLLDFNVIIVMILMIAVAGFNMISGLLILLFERISMIGVLKALGMRDRSIHKIFMTRAMVLVLTGMVVGNIMAYIIAFVQYKWQVIPLDPTNYFVDHVPISPSFIKIMFFNFAAFGVIFLLLLIPSMFISRVSPEKTLKVK